jgi:alkylation response protein AidB-like acyl-CoA dehydrogenase
MGQHFDRQEGRATMCATAAAQKDGRNTDWQKVLDELGPRFAERAGDHDNNDTFVFENYAELKEHRFFSAQIPTKLGGGGLLHSEMCDLIRRLGGYCSSTALATSMHQHLIAASVWNYKHGNPGQKLLEKVAANELVLVSTGAKDWLESNGTVERVDGGYKVSAVKIFASGSAAGDMVITSAPYEDPEEGWQVLHFPVPLNAEGVRIDEVWRAHGMRGTGSNNVVLEGVFVPDEAVVLKRSRGEYHPVWNVIITVALPLIASAYVGIAETAAEIARERAKKSPTDPILPILMGEMENQLAITRAMHRSAIAHANNWDFEPTVENGNTGFIHKTVIVRAAAATVGKAVEAAGGPAYLRSSILERLWRDVTAGNFHPMAEKRQQLFTGRLAMGLEPISGEAM